MKCPLGRVYDTFWVSEPMSTGATWMVDLGKLYFVAGGIFLDWEPGFEALDYDVYTGPNKTNMTLLESMRGNNETSTQHLTHFVAQYVELRLIRPSLVNGDGMYALIRASVMFDPNMAHGKEAWATHTINASLFREELAADDVFKTIWLAPMAQDRSWLYIDLLYDWRLSGMDVIWRRPPYEYAIECLDPTTRDWIETKRLVAPKFQRHVAFYNYILDGFDARKIAFQIYKADDSVEGKIVALREILLHFPERRPNYALQQRDNGLYEASHAEILGNLPYRAVDGDQRSSYWQPGWGVRSAWFKLTIPYAGPGDAAGPEIRTVGRIKVWWRYAPDTYTVTIWDGDPLHLPVVVYEGFDEVTTAVTDFTFLRKCRTVRVDILKTQTEIGIFSIGVYGYYSQLPPKIEKLEEPWNTTATNVLDLSTQTYWMAPPKVLDVILTVDLLDVYWVWEINIWYGFEAQGFFLDVSIDGVVWTRLPTRKVEFGLYELDEISEQFECRYVKILHTRPYVDEEGMFSTSIRDLAVYRFRNLAKNRSVEASTVWEYLPGWATDGDPETAWVARLGDEEAHIQIDLLDILNVAGMKFEFGYPAAQYEILYLDHETGLWTRSKLKVNNRAKIVEYDFRSLQFKTRYIRLAFGKPMERIYHPDHFGVEWEMMFCMSVVQIEVFEHTGGGGLVGIQSLDGQQWTTIAYGLSNPGEWTISSEEDLVTRDFGRDPIPYDIGNKVHLVVTFENVGTVNGIRTTQVIFYRNGVRHGQSYTYQAPVERLSKVNETRIVMGVRSSNHTWPYNASLYGPGYPDPTRNVKHGRSHSPYFSGRIYNLTLLKNALTKEEVRGLYEAVAIPDGKELSCHCYDACPTGSNRFFPDIPVPCSGQGACVKDALREYGGYCVCAEGYSGPACETHCSTLSEVGCCENDDDCPTGQYCNSATKACTVR
eukprot:TRINITY_DN20917_c0_g1_i1.p1 TRINITY_DN20917_c0_g1~~TRINITY_DN20917_c0_g1_i1.p1  ORF type:complete len:937 (-),score=111.83 TRINITY_DN20917_c0_g1_i1:287-3097(-)